MTESTRLYDAYDRPVNLAALRREHAAPQVAGVRTVSQDTVASGLTPKRLAALIRRADDADHHDYLTLAEEIEERDGHYRSVLANAQRRQRAPPRATPVPPRSAHRRARRAAPWGARRTP
jgi:phage gp29-like protein